MRLKYFIALIILVSGTFALSSCEEEGDDFSGPTSQALSVTFGTGFDDEVLRDVSIDKNGVMYVTAKTKIYKVDASGNATVFAGSNTSGVTDGQGTAATFRNIDLLSFDESGNIYTIDFEVIRKISPDGVVTTLAVTEPYPFLIKELDDPDDRAVFKGVAIQNNLIYASYGTILVKISGDGWNIFSGGKNLEQGFVDGQGNEARFIDLGPIVISGSGENLICGDEGSLREISIADSTVTTITGSDTFGQNDGTLAEASFQTIHDIAIDNNGNYYLSTFNTVRKVTTDGSVSTIAGPIKPDGSSFRGGGMAIDASGKYLYVTDVNKNATVIKIDISK